MKILVLTGSVENTQYSKQAYEPGKNFKKS